MAKDWFGNKSFLNCNRTKKDSERSERDLYGTHPDSVRSFLDFCNFETRHKIWEPACGTMTISKVLKERGLDVFSTDIHDYNCGQDGIIDFLQAKTLPKGHENIDVIFTNPPYKYSTEFVTNSMKLLPNRGVLIMFLKLTFLEGKKRYSLYQKYPLHALYVHSSRQGCSPSGEFDFFNGGAVAYGWFVWIKGDVGPASIYHLPPNS